MLNSLSRRIVNKFLCNDSSSDADALTLGVFIILSDILYLCICVICGLIFKVMLEMMIFFISFLLLRRYAGGYHSKKEIVCEILSTVSLLACAFIIKNFEINIYSILFIIVSIIIILFFAPICSDSNPTSDEEKIRYKKLTILILFIIISVMVVAYVFKNVKVFSACAVCVIFESILVLAGKIKLVLDSKHLTNKV